MLLFDEKLKQLDVNALKEELKKGLDGLAVPTKDEITNDLSKYYKDAALLDGAQYNLKLSFAELNLSTEVFPSLGDILDKIQEFVCQVITDASTNDDIINAILDAIASVIPGGIIFKWVVKKLVKYILNLGANAFCDVVSE